MSAGPALAGLLGHDNLLIVDAAENALWAIWFREGGPVARAVLYRIDQGIQTQRTENVTAMITELIRAYPAFAEAYHQRAQAHYLDSEFSSALRDARRAHELNPLHFAALALTGHCLALLGRYQDALKTYREVLKIYPKMAGIRESMRAIRSRLEPARVPA
jgi:tetratricopeptide (TPR) repeat protein